MRRPDRMLETRQPTCGMAATITWLGPTAQMGEFGSASAKTMKRAIATSLVGDPADRYRHALLSRTFSGDSGSRPCFAHRLAGPSAGCCQRSETNGDVQPKTFV
jgi:hypothetical protein